MRICSLLPSATEMLYAIGAGDSVVGVTHECDFPLQVAEKPALIRPRIDPHAAPAEIDRHVSELVARGESIYAVDADLLRSLSPDLIVTQDLCHVCAASPDDLATALTSLAKQPRVLSLTPHTLADVWEDIRRIGEATGCYETADALATTLGERVNSVAIRAKPAGHRPRVLCLEWLDPYYVAGHWVPEMVSLAGGQDVLGLAGQPSFPVAATDIARSDAEIIIVMPCGYNLERASAEFRALQARIFQDFSTWKNRCIYAVDANSYFSRPGPRLAEGVAILARVIHPELFVSDTTESDFERIAR